MNKTMKNILYHKIAFCLENNVYPNCYAFRAFWYIIKVWVHSIFVSCPNYSKIICITIDF